MYSVIVLDDEKLIRYGIKSILEMNSNHYKVVGEAGNGEEGLKLIREIRPDIAIMDIRMPKGTGLDILKVLHDEGITCKTIILTAHADFEYARKAVNYNADSYILKPINEEELLSELERITNTHTVKNYIPENEIAKEMINEILNKNNNLHPLIYKALKFTGENFKNNISLLEVSENYKVSISYFSDLFSKTMGISFVRFLNHFRIDISKRLLLEYNVKISDVAEKVGFSNTKYFSKVFIDLESKTPSDFIKNNPKNL
jgi:two-component system response regulator YesN